MDIVRVNKKSVRLLCVCENEFKHELGDWEADFLEWANQYENLTVGPCPVCNRQAILNLNLPLTEEDDEEVQDPDFEGKRRTKRKKYRDLIWQRRKDLKGKDRAKHEKEKGEQFVKKHGKTVSELRKMSKNAMKRGNE